MSELILLMRLSTSFFLLWLVCVLSFALSLGTLFVVLLTLRKKLAGRGTEGLPIWPVPLCVHTDFLRSTAGPLCSLDDGC